MKKLSTSILLIGICLTLSGCGAPKPPMPYGTPIPINEGLQTNTQQGNGTNVLFESTQTELKKE